MATVNILAPSARLPSSPTVNPFSSSTRISPASAALYKSLIVCYEGVLYFHASVEADFSVVYVNVDVLIHVRLSTVLVSENDSVADLNIYR